MTAVLQAIWDDSQTDDGIFGSTSAGANRGVWGISTRRLWHWRSRCSLGLYTLLLLVTLRTLAGAKSYSMDQVTIAGGGGTCSGGQFTLSGTIATNQSASRLNRVAGHFQKAREVCKRSLPVRFHLGNIIRN